MNRAADALRPAFTAKQGQFLAFIHAYTLVNGRPPAEADMMRFFRLTPPSVHQMVLTLEKAGLISRQPGVPRSIVVLLHRSALPELNPGHSQPVKTTVQRYIEEIRDLLRRVTNPALRIAETARILPGPCKRLRVCSSTVRPTDA